MRKEIVEGGVYICLRGKGVLWKGSQMCERSEVGDPTQFTSSTEHKRYHSAIALLNHLISLKWGIF
jgi:hypothetical protein